MTANPEWVELVFDVSDDEQVDISIELPDTALVRLQALVTAPVVVSTQVPAVIAPPVAAPAALPSVAVEVETRVLAPAPPSSSTAVANVVEVHRMPATQTIVINAPQVTIVTAAPTLAAPSRRGLLGVLIPAALIGLGLWVALEAMIARCCR